MHEDYGLCLLGGQMNERWHMEQGVNSTWERSVSKCIPHKDWEKDHSTFLYERMGWFMHVMRKRLGSLALRTTNHLAHKGKNKPCE